MIVQNMAEKVRSLIKVTLRALWVLIIWWFLLEFTFLILKASIGFIIVETKSLEIIEDSIVDDVEPI